MDCTAPLFLETLINLSVITNPGTLCSVVLTGGKDIGEEVAFDCTQVDRPWQELLYGTLFEGDGAFATDILTGVAGDIDRIEDCGPDGLETLFRRVLKLGTLGNRIRVFKTGEMFGSCTDCDEDVSRTPLLTRILGTFIKVDGEYRVRIEDMDGSFPSVENVNCNSAAASPWAMLAGAISYDASTKTWFWNTITI